MVRNFREKALASAEEDQESTKAKILSAAETLFSENGFSGTTIRDIADSAGVNIALIHYHWGSKEELWNAVHYHLLSKFLEFFGGLLAEFPQFDERESVEAIISRVFDFYSEHTSVPKLIQQQGPVGTRREWIKDMGRPFFESGIEMLKQNENIRFDPIEPELAIVCIMGAVTFFFTAPHLMAYMLDENPDDYSPSFRKKASAAISTMIERFAQFK